MGKASRTKHPSARQRIAAEREEARRAERRNRILLTVGSAVVVLAVVAALVLVKVLGGKSSQAQPSATGTLLPASVSRSVTGVPVSTLAAVGPGSVPEFLQSSHQPHAFTPITGPPLLSNGKPEMLYIGAEFCPYCAGMRWAMAVALSRFGTLSPLRGIHSAPSPEIYPDTATLPTVRRMRLRRCARRAASRCAAIRCRALRFFARLALLIWRPPAIAPRHPLVPC